MKNDNIIQKKSFEFAVRIVNAFKYLKHDKKEYIMSKQLLRCGTSIGANIEESIGGQSKADFISKISIAYKEARESVYWIKLLEATGYLNTELAISLKEMLKKFVELLQKFKSPRKNEIRNS